MRYFENSVALVTGGASGIGRELCKQLAQRGATVVVADIDYDGALKVASGINENAGKAQTKSLDVSDAARFSNVAQEVVQEFEGIDYLFNNAGIGVYGNTCEMSLEQWSSIISVNLIGVINGIAAVYPAMIEAKSGHIVNTASLAGLIPVPTLTAYATTKHAVVGLSTSLRPEAEQHGVRVSAVCPGFVQSNIFNSTCYVGVDREKAIANLPLKPISEQKCVEAILKGVAKNKPIITTPRYATLMWRLYRLSPALFYRLSNKSVKKLSRF
jgi:short-subunit dehydrogenase